MKRIIRGLLMVAVMWGFFAGVLWAPVITAGLIVVGLFLGLSAVIFMVGYSDFGLD